MRWKNWMGIMLLWLGLSAGAQGAEFAIPEKTGGGNVAVKAGTSPHNLYAAGATVRVESPVTGDLHAVGGVVLIQAPIEKDLVAVGGTLSVLQPVGDDARLAGGTVELASSVGGDLIAGAGQLALKPGSSVKGDVIVAGGLVKLEGTVQGKVRAAGGRIVLNGDFAGDVTVRSKGVVEVGPKCRVKGELVCYAPSPVAVPKEAVVPNLVFHQVAGGKQGKCPAGTVGALVGLGAFIKLAAWILAAWLLLMLFRRPLNTVLQAIRTNPLRGLGMGFVVFVVALIALPLMFLTLVGYYIALVAGALLVVGSLTARLLAGFYMGFLLRKWIQKKQEGSPSFGWVAVGILVLHLLGFIPILGWLITLGLSLVAFGTLWDLTVKNVSTMNREDTP